LGPSTDLAGALTIDSPFFDVKDHDGLSLALIGTRRVVSRPRTRFFSRVVMTAAAKSKS
jgi:hypothetical protein